MPKKAGKKHLSNPLPIPRRSTVIVIQAVLLALGHRSAKPSQDFIPVAFPGFALHYSGGTAPALNRTSLLSPEGHLHQIFFFSLCFTLS